MGEPPCHSDRLRQRGDPDHSARRTVRQVPRVHQGRRGQGPGPLPVLQAHLGVGRHRGGHRRPEADHAGVEQLPRPDPSPQGARGRLPRAPHATARAAPAAGSSTAPSTCTSSSRRRSPSSWARKTASSSRPGTAPTSASSRAGRPQDDVVFLDKLDHASIVDGAKMSYGTTDALQARRPAPRSSGCSAPRRRRGPRLVIVVDGVYSMEGDIADVPELVRLCRQVRRGAGHRRRPLPSASSAPGRRHRRALRPDRRGRHHRRHLLASRSRRSAASSPAPSSVINYLRHHSRPLIFTASLPPANTAGVLAALEVMQQEPERRETPLGQHPAAAATGFRAARLRHRPHGNADRAGPDRTARPTFIIWRKLFDAGVFTNPVVPPAVPPAQCRLRTSLMATHTDRADRLLPRAFARIGKELGVI